MIVMSQLGHGVNIGDGPSVRNIQPT
jgi:hypothetical protein